MKACHTWISKNLALGILGTLFIGCSSKMTVLTTPVSVGGDAVEESDTNRQSGTSQTVIDDELVMTVYANSPVGLVAPIRGAAGYEWEQVSGPSQLELSVVSTHIFRFSPA